MTWVVFGASWLALLLQMNSFQLQESGICDVLFWWKLLQNVYIENVPQAFLQLWYMLPTLMFWRFFSCHVTQRCIEESRMNDTHNNTMSLWNTICLRWRNPGNVILSIKVKAIVKVIHPFVPLTLLWQTIQIWKNKRCVCETQMSQREHSPNCFSIKVTRSKGHRPCCHLNGFH